MKKSLAEALGAPHARIVITILLISLVLRWILIFRGGQYYIADETRYETSRDVARLLVQGQPVEALKQFTLLPEHLGFKVAGVLPALLEQITGPSLSMPAMFFSLFSVLNLYLIFLISRRTSTSANVPLFALVLAASCFSLLYYSRHLFPYDMAMSFGLLALYTALVQPQTIKTSLICGGLSFLCFITYNGYWSLAGFAMLINVLLHGEKITRMLQKATFTAIGFLAPLVFVIVLMLGLGTNIVSAYRLFATTITQGSFEEGWSLPFAYFWYTEHTVILVLGALSFYAWINAFKGLKNRTGLWAGGLLFVYLCLLIPSVFLHYFVVYGRLARQMLPFLVLLSAEGIALLESRLTAGRKIVLAILMITFLQAAGNFILSYNLAYPRDFAARAQAMFPKFEFSTKRLAFGAPVICQNNGYLIENAKYYVTPPEMIPPPIQGQLLLSARHPSTFRPYQYDGDPPATRQAFDLLQLKMNFYKLDEHFMSETNPEWMAIKNCMVSEKNAGP